MPTSPLRRLALPEVDDVGETVFRHANAHGVVLVTRVDREGNPRFHELTVGSGLVVEWHSGLGVRTGRVEAPRGGPSAKPRTAYDTPPSREAVRGAIAAVGEPEGDAIVQGFVTVLADVLARW